MKNNNEKKGIVRIDIIHNGYSLSWSSWSTLRELINIVGHHYKSWSILSLPPLNQIVLEPSLNVDQNHSTSLSNLQLFTETLLSNKSH